MPTILRRILLGALFLLIIAGCEEFETKLNLPPKTTDGRNTLGFTTNGEIWVNRGDICNWPRCEENVVEGRLHTYADKSLAVVIQAYSIDDAKKSSQNFSISAKNITGVGTYLLEKDKEESINLTTDWTKNIFYNNLKDSNAKLLITRMDTVNHIISGEFSGKLYNFHDPTKAIDISEGRFDTKLTYSND